MNFNNKWKTFLNESRAHVREENTLTEEELAIIAEGRIEDATKKYPRVNYFVKRLADLDPSKNNKYLMWMTKQLNAYFNSLLTVRMGGVDPDSLSKLDIGTLDRDEYFTDLYNHSIQIGNIVEQFHKNVQRIKNKDINSYKTIQDLQDVLDEIGFSKRQKRRKEREKAMEGSDIMFEDDNFFVVRPNTEKSSCYYGRATRWCISSTESKNYFDQYTGEGKAFYMVMLKNLPEDDDLKKVALVFNTDGELEEIFDAPDDSIQVETFSVGIYRNLISGYVSKAGDVERFDQEHAEEEYSAFSIEVLRKIQDEYSDHDVLPEDDDEIEYSHAEELFQSIESHIMYPIERHAAENPAGPDEGAYQAILDSVELNHIHVHYEENYDAPGMYFSAYGSIELPDTLRWVDTGDGQPVAADYEDDILEIFGDVADDVGVYPDEKDLETGFTDESTYIRLSFNPDYDEGGLDGFERFVNRMSNYDDLFDEMLKETIEKIEDKGLVHSDKRKAAQKIFEELPEFKHLDKKLLRGSIILEYSFDIDVTGLLKDLKFHELDLSRSEEREPHEMAAKQRGYLQSKLALLERYFNINRDFNTVFLPKLPELAQKIQSMKRKQLDLPLEEAQYLPDVKEEVLKYVLQPYNDTFKFEDVDVDASPRERIKGKLNIDIDLSRGEPYANIFINFVSWIDKHMQEVNDLMVVTTRQLASKIAEEAKVFEPELFDSGWAERAAEEREAEYREGIYLMRTPGGLEERNRRARGMAPRIYDIETKAWIPAPPEWKPGELRAGETLPINWKPSAQAENKKNKLVTDKNIFESWRKFLK